MFFLRTKWAPLIIFLVYNIFKISFSSFSFSFFPFCEIYNGVCTIDHRFIICFQLFVSLFSASPFFFLIFNHREKKTKKNFFQQDVRMCMCVWMCGGVLSIVATPFNLQPWNLRITNNNIPHVIISRRVFKIFEKLFYFRSCCTLYICL